MFKPSVRERKRYIVFSIQNKERQTFENVEKAIKKQGLDFLGEKGLGEAGLIFPPELWNGKRGVIRVSNKKVNEAIISLALIKEFIIIPEKTCGMIKKAKRLMEE